MQYKDCNKSKGYVPNGVDFIEFSKQIFESLDYDPVYPVLMKYFDMRGLNLEEKLFGVQLYLTIYNTYWTLYFLEKYKKPYSLLDMVEDPAVKDKKVSIGTDRRGVAWTGLPKVFPEIQSFFDNNGNMTAYFTNRLNGTGLDNLKVMKRRVLAIPYNGPWAAFKHLDMLLNCVGLPIEFDDWWVKGRPFGGKQLVIDMEKGLGHKLGHDLKETADIVDLINDFSIRWTDTFKEVVSPQVTFDISETFACKYHATYQGTYYAGHDIDKMQKEICGYDNNVDAIMYELRRKCFNKSALGELSGWKGVRNQLKGKLLMERDELSMAKATARCSCKAIYEKLGYDVSGCNGCAASTELAEQCEDQIVGLIQASPEASPEAQQASADADQHTPAEEPQEQQFDWSTCSCRASYEAQGCDVSNCEGCDGSCFEECNSNVSNGEPAEEVAQDAGVDQNAEVAQDEALTPQNCPYRAVYEFNGYDVSGCDNCACDEAQAAECTKATESLEQPPEKEVQEGDNGEEPPWECPHKAVFVQNGYDVTNCEQCDCSEEQMAACKAVVDQL